MKYFLPLLILTIYFQNTSSQTLSNKVIASGGAFSTASWGSLSATLGEALITTLPSTNLTLLQGFQQPSSGLSGITVHQEINSFLVYPNPARNEVILEITPDMTSDISYMIFDIRGKEIIHDNFRAEALISNSKKIDVAFLCNGIYLVQINIGHDFVQNIKILVSH